MFLKRLKCKHKLIGVLIVILGFLGMISSPHAAAEALNLSKTTIMVLGDSLSANHGVAPEKGWVSLLTTKLRKEKKNYQVVNVSMSGDTTSNGLSKLGSMLQVHQPKIVILELGANDGLRGLNIGVIKSNLEQMIKRIKDSQSKVLLIAMRVPPNYGVQYSNAFHNIYLELSKTYKISLVDNWMDSIQTNPKYLQKDNYHPNEDAQVIMLDIIWPKLKPML